MQTDIWSSLEEVLRVQVVREVAPNERRFGREASSVDLAQKVWPRWNITHVGLRVSARKHTAAGTSEQPTARAGK
jgi:hypothetical protein